MVKIVCFILRDFQHNKRKLFFKKNAGQSSLWTLLQKQLAPSQHTNTAYFTIKKESFMSTGSQLLSLHQRFLIVILALENNTQSFPHLLFSPTNVQGEKKTKYRSLGNTNIWQNLHGRKRKKQAISYTLHLSSLGQTNTQYIIRSPPTKG